MKEVVGRWVRLEEARAVCEQPVVFHYQTGKIDLEFWQLTAVVKLRSLTHVNV